LFGPARAAYVCAVNSQKRSNLITRASSGAVFVAVVVGALFAGPLATGVLFGIATFISLREYFSLTGFPSRKSDALAIGTGLVAYIITFLFALDLLPVSAFWVVGLLMLLQLSLDVLAVKPSPMQHAPVSISGVWYVALPFALIAMLTMLPGEWSPWIMLGFLLILWANDTGAYLVGMAIGKHKLFPSVSPNKTWEGLIGGVVLACGTAFLLSVFHDVPDTAGWITMALCVGVFANIGDLYESYLKRAAGVKDSGRIMPGHGGVLDRFDGLLFSLPAFLACYYLFLS